MAREDSAVASALASERSIRATYSKPYQSHGTVAPSCAVAQFDGHDLKVWAATQGVHPLKREIAAVTGLAIDRVTVIHEYGPGCYGQNGADDAAAFAAVAAQAMVGRPVRLQFSSADEFAWEPHGSAMAADLEAALDASGRVRGWRHRTLTDTHMARPQGQGDRVVVAWLRDSAAKRPSLQANAGGARNSVPLYDFAAVEAIADHVDGPLRTGPLRSLGAFLNIFAIESFMDELAEVAGVDPLAFRLAHLRDGRARELLEAAAVAAGWRSHIGPSGRGQGLAIGRYHDTAAYAAIVADAVVDLDANRLVVNRLVIAADAGTVVHGQGLRQQLEGGALQGLSRSLYEELAADARGIRSREWSTYPVLRFGDVPPLEIVVLDRSGEPPLGAGEAATPPVPAAIANAIDDAVGIRLRNLPLTTKALEARLLEMSEAEMERVIA